MNHILETKIKYNALDVHKKAMAEGLVRLKVYLMSDKFSVDTTVQVADVLRRLEEIQHEARNEKLDYENKAYSDARKKKEEDRLKSQRGCESDGCSYFGKDYTLFDMGGYSVVKCRKCYKLYCDENPDYKPVLVQF